MTEHYLPDHNIHRVWDNSLAPQLEIAPGDTVTFECREASNQALTPMSTLEDFINRKRGGGHPLTGPVLVQDAQPGDVLVVDVLDLVHKGWGWNSHAPNFGLLQKDFDYPYLQHWRLEGDFCYFRDSDKVKLPFEPFCGVMGVAPKEAGEIPTGPPAFHGGNMDIRGLTRGATLFLPVHVAGALFSTGDCHAAQGDGEVSGTGIESPMTVTLRFDLRKGQSIPEPQFITPSPLTKTDTLGSFCTTAHGPDLFVNSQNAVRYMIDWLEREHGLARSQAYCLCSAAADLKISEIVDAPNWIVACYMPLSIFS
ncbi:MAG: acetamidase/formamidase family protein [Caldilineaceae bacterium]|nr:acetamidase/formamidase family protein [Caldilineaceae bacterium]